MIRLTDEEYEEAVQQLPGQYNYYKDSTMVIQYKEETLIATNPDLVPLIYTIDKGWRAIGLVAGADIVIAE